MPRGVSNPSLALIRRQPEYQQRQLMLPPLWLSEAHICSYFEWLPTPLHYNKASIPTDRIKYCLVYW